MEYRRRQFLTTPGESLLLPLQAMDIVERLTALTRSSGLDKAAIVSSPLVAVPLLRRDAGARWPSTVEPSLLANPLFWLPERLAYPADGVSNDIWAISVALEVTLAGLYDVETGTWLDVLSTVGLDVEDEIVQARIVEWLEGAPDEDLDRIDLSEGLEVGDPTWSLGQAEELLPLLVPASWAVLSNDLIGTASDALVPQDLRVEDLTDTARNVIYVAQGAIGDGPAHLDGEESAFALWQRILDDLPNWPARGLDSVVEGPYDALVESLYTIRNDYWVFVEALWENQNLAAPVAA